MAQLQSPCLSCQCGILRNHPVVKVSDENSVYEKPPEAPLYLQWWKVTWYIYSSTVIMYFIISISDPVALQIMFHVVLKVNINFIDTLVTCTSYAAVYIVKK